jgi:DNA mismatch repair protein MSH6
MARGIEGNEVSTPKPPSLKKSNSSQNEKNQRTLFGFFQKKESQSSQATSQASVASHKSSPIPAKSSGKRNGVRQGSTTTLTPAPSSDAPAPPSPELDPTPLTASNGLENQENGLPSPITPADAKADVITSKDQSEVTYFSPSRKVRLMDLTGRDRI